MYGFPSSNLKYLIPLGQYLVEPQMVLTQGYVSILLNVYENIFLLIRTCKREHIGCGVSVNISFYVLFGLFGLFMFELWVIWSADENALIIVIVDLGSPVKLFLKLFAASNSFLKLLFRISFYLAPSSFTSAITGLFFEENYKQTAATNILGVVCSWC